MENFARGSFGESENLNVTNDLVHPVPQVPQQPEHVEEKIDSSNRREDTETKQRKNRSNYTPRQVEIMEFAYVKHAKYPPADVREILANSMGLKEAQVRVWFQNRRAKDKRKGSSGQSQAEVFRSLYPPVTSAPAVTTSDLRFSPQVPLTMNCSQPIPHFPDTTVAPSMVQSKQWHPIEPTMFQTGSSVMSSNSPANASSGGLLTSGQTAPFHVTYPPNVNFFNSIKPDFNTRMNMQPIPYFGPNYHNQKCWRPYLPTAAQAQQPQVNGMYTSQGLNPNGSQYSVPNSPSNFSYGFDNAPFPEPMQRNCINENTPISAMYQRFPVSAPVQPQLKVDQTPQDV